MKPRDKTFQGGGAATTDPRKPDYANLFALKGVDWDDPTVAQLAAHLSGAFENSNTAPGSGTGNNFGASLNYDQGPVSAMLATPSWTEVSRAGCAAASNR